MSTRLLIGSFLFHADGRCVSRRGIVRTNYLNHGRRQELALRFPRSHTYSLEWIREGGMGSHPLWLTEWLSRALDLRPGMRVLDLGCGRASRRSSAPANSASKCGPPTCGFTATRKPATNPGRRRRGGVFPIHADARSLPFAAEFFDAIVSIDSYSYYGTDDLYLNYLARFVKPGGQIGIAGAGLTQEIDGPCPSNCARGGPRTSGACTRPTGGGGTGAHRHRGRRARRRHARRVANLDPLAAQNSPDNVVEISAVDADAGRYLTYIRTIARRRAGVELQPYCWPDGSFTLPHAYERKEVAPGSL